VADLDHALKTILGLRDFFMARNAPEMAQAFQLLAESCPENSPDEPDWALVEFAYNRLFIGPNSVVAAPVASIYIDTEPYVMGNTTLTIRRLYETVGLVSPWQGSLPEDHLALELDACRQLRANLGRSGSPDLLELYGFLIENHMAEWIPIFVARVMAHSDTPAVIGWICRKLKNWLTLERQWIAGQTRNESKN